MRLLLKRFDKELEAEDWEEVVGEVGEVVGVSVRFCDVCEDSFFDYVESEWPSSEESVELILWWLV